MVDRRTNLRAMARIEIYDGSRRPERVPLYIAGNVSIGGMFLFTQEPFPVGSDLRMSFSLPGEQNPITVRACVVWVRESRQAADRQAGMGVRFLEIDEKDRERIHDFVEAQSETEPESKAKT